MNIGSSITVARRLTLKTYSKAVDDFLRASSSWLKPEDAPAIATLQNMALELDEGATPAMVSTFGLTYRSLLKRAPGAAAEVDPVDDIIAGARA